MEVSMLFLISSIFERIGRPRRRIAGAIIFLGVVTAAGIGLRRHWWSHPSPLETVREHWEQARLAIEERDFPVARKHLDQCLEICPVNAEAQFLMARTCRRDGDLAASNEHLLMAESMDWPGEQILLERQLQQAASGNSWSVERALLDQLNHLPSEEVLILEALVNGYLNNARYIDAIEIINSWLKRHPSDWLAYLYRGRANQGLSHYERAIEDFEQAEQLRPDFLQTHLWLADTLLAHLQYERALEHYEIYIQAGPPDTDILLAMALCQVSLGKPEARTILDQLMVDHPNDAGIILLAAKLDLVEDAPEQALRRARQALTLSPRDPDVVYFVGQVLSRLNRRNEAEQFRKEHHQLFDQADQLFNLKKRIGVEPEDASLRYQAGMLCLNIGQEKEAFSWFESVLWIDPNHRSTHQALAEICKKHGQVERAAYHRRRAEGK
jgi:tetratricopeptide (TPR) repeat protein